MQSNREQDEREGQREHCAKKEKILMKRTKNQTVNSNSNFYAILKKFLTALAAALNETINKI